ncbi:hypothetical protein D1872_245260 [compost metagenome]
MGEPRIDVRPQACFGYGTRIQAFLDQTVKTEGNDARPIPFVFCRGGSADPFLRGIRFLDARRAVDEKDHLLLFNQSVRLKSGHDHQKKHEDGGS